MSSRIILFNKPIWCVVDSNEDSRTIAEIYGFKPTPDITKEEIENYIDYLCGVSKWGQEGNGIDSSYWFATSGKIYCDFSNFVSNYIKMARQQAGLTYLVYDTNKTLDDTTEGMLEGSFLISRTLYKNIKDYGVQVDVT